MKVIQGKQAVLRSYLSEEQCAKPVQGQLAVPGKPIDYAMKNVSVKEAELSKPREHFVQATEAQAVAVREQSVENAVVKELPTVPLRSTAATVETSRIMDIAEEDDLTIEQLFARRQSEVG